MSACVNTNTVEFQTLVKESGLPDFYVSAVCGEFMDKYGRFPYLDELPGSNSELYLSEHLNIKNGGTKIDNILNFSGKNSVEEALININNTFRDVEVDILPLNTEAIVNITKRPITKALTLPKINHNHHINNPLLFSNIINKLLTLYGILINEVDNEMIQNSELSKLPGVALAKAFVHNNLIYVNTDYADIDAPVHEMMHILLGSIRSSNPELYFNVVNVASSLENFQDYIDKYPNRTMSDILEEAFVEEFSKLATLGNSQLKELPENIKYELFYSAKRVLDTILMGESSIRNYSDTKLFNSSLSELCELVNSSLDTSNFKGTISIENGEVHRLLANKKQELFENKELEEYCNG